jgi:hypothetical protein
MVEIVIHSRVRNRRFDEALGWIIRDRFDVTDIQMGLCFHVITDPKSA